MFSKKLTKKLLALGAAAILALAAAGCGGSDKADAPKEAANGKLTIAINATFPPFESVKEGTHDYVGVDIDIARYIGQKLGKEVTFTDMKFASLVPTLQSGRADMIVSAISPTDERKEVLDFTEPYYYPMKAIICQKGAGYGPDNDLSGKSPGKMAACGRSPGGGLFPGVDLPLLSLRVVAGFHGLVFLGCF